MRTRASDANEGNLARPVRAEARARLMEAMLQVVGEVGYEAVSVQKVLDHHGGCREQFYRFFASKQDCYLAAYEAEMSQLCEALLGAGREQESWPAGLRATLEEFGRYAVERPAVARGLLIGAHAAGKPARALRTEFLERLSRAMDSARRENKSRHSPPPITAAFILGAIEESMVASLIEGQPQNFRLAIPELTWFAVLAYLGEEVAREERVA
jgi:AcrR family transcriptional regulator